MTQPQIAMKRAQRNFAIGFILAALAINALIVLAPDVETKNYYGNLLRPIVAGVAMLAALTVVYRQGVSGIFGKAYAGLAAGLVSYFIAEILWAYYSIGLGIEVPYPSLADAFWLAAYAPFGYGLFKLSKLYSRRGNKNALVFVCIAVIGFACYYIWQLISVTDLSGPDSTTGLAIGIAYPILDAILIIPAVLAVMSSGKGYLTAIPWIFISWILTAIADAIFGFTAVVSIAGDISIWNLFYNAAYLSMAAGLIWHNKYMIFDSKTSLMKRDQVK
jgi:hypothetical protein